MAGAFLVLVIGMGLSVITALVEFFWVSRSALANENVRQFKVFKDASKNPNKSKM